MSVGDYIDIYINMGQWFTLVDLHSEFEGPAGAEVKDTSS